MINPKNKRVQVTLPNETTELLNSLSIRYNKSISEIVKWAIYTLAAKKKHNIVLKLREQNQEEITNSNNNSEDHEYTDEEIDELLNTTFHN